VSTLSTEDESMYVNRAMSLKVVLQGRLPSSLKHGIGGNTEIKLSRARSDLAFFE
jgi:hypothetical protein